MNRVAVAVLLVALLALLGVGACGDDQPKSAAIPPWANVAPEQIAEAKKHGVPVAFENDLGMRFVLIPAGTFLMGSPEDEEGRDDDETQHEVTLTKSFYMQVSEVTLGQLRKMKPHDPRTFWGADAPSTDEFSPGYWEDDRPASHVLRAEAWRFARWLSDRVGGRSYVFPGEAQWEHACRAGTQGAFWQGDQLDTSVANLNWMDAALYGERAESDTTKTVAGHYPANPWGLYDMHGNMTEWCGDRYAKYPGAAPRVDPTGPLGPTQNGSRWVVRGGSYMSSPSQSRSASRSANRTHRRDGTDGGRHFVMGFRLVTPLPESSK